MKLSRVAIVTVATSAAVLAGIAACNGTPALRPAPSGADSELTAFIDKIRAVDNHSHANSTAPADSDFDALPLDGIAFEAPVAIRPDNPVWLAAYRALYHYPHPDLNPAHLSDLRTTIQGVAKQQGDGFPGWVLDQVGTDVMLANRIAMGPGLPSPRFRWVSYADPLMMPLSTKALAAGNPDREKLFPLTAKLLRRYLADLKIAKLPGTLDGYLKTVVTPTLEAQRKGGCVAIKFEAAYLRSLDFDEASAEAAASVYAKYAAGGEPSPAASKTLQDFLFRFIAREAGRLGMAVHIHSFEGFGNGYRTAGSDPLLLEPAFTDPTLKGTNFVIVHGGGVFASHTGAMLWKPNVYADISLMTIMYPVADLATVLRGWLTRFPEKVLFGSDASALGPDLGWEVGAWVGGKNGRAALALALTEMINNGEVSRVRAEAIATMVMRTNAGTLYRLGLQ